MKFAELHNGSKDTMYSTGLFCHNEPPIGVHFNAENMKKLKAKYQAQIMEQYGMTVDDFIFEFGKNYLE